MNKRDDSSKCNNAFFPPPEQRTEMAMKFFGIFFIAPVCPFADVWLQQFFKSKGNLRQTEQEKERERERQFEKQRAQEWKNVKKSKNRMAQERKRTKVKNNKRENMRQEQQNIATE